MKRALATLACAALLGGCASAPRPASLSSAAEAESAPAVVQARTRAPQAHARAQELLRQAEAAYDEGRQADAELLGEHALAAYRRAVIEARLATAETRRAEAEAKLADAERALAALDNQNKRALSEAENLELKLKVVREILPVPASATASPERERARLDAARSFALEARLLCTSARLLQPDRESLAPHFTKLDELDKRIETKALPAPLDEARVERTSCLRELTLTRRPVTQLAPGTPHADGLLSELSGSGLMPTRDDRGVVVTLREVFRGSADITPAARERLQGLGRVAKTHPTFPVLVVVHSSKSGYIERDKQRAQAVAKVLTEQGAGRVETHAAGTAQPLLGSEQASSAARNERVELVFVAPGAT